MTRLLLAALVAPGLAVDMDTLPEPYAVRVAETPLTSQYGLHPVPGMTLPVLELEPAVRRDLSSKCARSSPRAVLTVLPGAGRVLVQERRGHDRSVVFADGGESLARLFAQLPKGESLRAGAIVGTRQPPEKVWCGPKFVVASRRSAGARFDAVSLLDRSALDDALRANHFDGLIIVEVHPDTSWQTLVSFLVTFDDHLLPDSKFPRVHVALSRSAPPLEPVVPVLGPRAEPTSLDVRVELEGRLVAHFETPTRLVHATGQVLATYEGGVISTGIPCAPNTCRARRDEVELVNRAGWRPRGASGGTMELSDGTLTMGSGEHSVPVGQIVGTPNATGEAMIRLGLLHADIPEVTIGQLARATWDGRVVRGGEDTGRWSAEGIQFGTDIFGLTELSTLSGEGELEELQCRPAPGAEVAFRLTRTSSTDASGEWRGPRGWAYPLPLHTLDHPEVRAACIASAMHLAELDALPPGEPEVEVEDGVLGGVMVNGQRGVIDGSFLDDWMRGYAPVHHSALELKRQSRAVLPAGAAPLAEGAPRCRVRVFIDERGIPERARAEACPEPLRAAAIEAVLDWRWKRPEFDGQNRHVQTVVGVEFETPE